MAFLNNIKTGGDGDDVTYDIQNAPYTATSIPANRDILFFNNSMATIKITFTTATSPELYNWSKTIGPNQGFNYRAPAALATCTADAEFLHTGSGALDVEQGKDDNGDPIGAVPQARFIAAQLGGSFGA